MKIPKIDSNIYSTLILILASIILAVAILLTDRKDITSAAVVLSAMVLFLSGVYIFTFTKKESVDGRISSILPVQSLVNVCRIVSDLGISGNSFFLPKGYTEDGTCMQYLPVSNYNGEKLPVGTFIYGQRGAGLLLPPSGNILLSELKERYSLSIPDSKEELATCIREIGEELLEIADKVMVSVSDESVTVNISNYKLSDGCHLMAKESPACCTIYPCSVCSLFAAILAEGTGIPIQVERCMVRKRKADVEMIFSLISYERASET